MLGSVRSDTLWQSALRLSILSGNNDGVEDPETTTKQTESQISELTRLSNAQLKAGLESLAGQLWVFLSWGEGD